MKLVIFDLDGTLVDSGASIVRRLRAAFSETGTPSPDDATILSGVGLSLEVAIARLFPESAKQKVDDIAAAYREITIRERTAGDDQDSLYPGARAAIELLAGRDEVLLGIATGKAMRGVHHFLEVHGFAREFVTLQAADVAPSKPHPGMVLQAMAEIGAEPADTWMVGDTTYDIQMARSAGASAIGVSWGFHESADLKEVGASLVVDGFDALVPALDGLWEKRIADG